jgi:hypothetical protein
VQGILFDHYFCDRAGGTVNTAIVWFIRIWLALAIFVNVISIVGLFVGANSFLEGIDRVADVYSPFNIINFMTEVVLFSPAIGAYFWLEYRRKKDRSRHAANATSPLAVSNKVENSTTSKIDARDVIGKYGAVLSTLHRHSLSTIHDVSDLPYPKQVIRQVLREALSRFPADKNEAIKSGYILLAEFQELTAEEKNALAISDLSDPGASVDAIREEAKRISSSAVCLERVEGRVQNEQLELVQDLKSLGLWGT